MLFSSTKVIISNYVILGDMSYRLGYNPNETKQYYPKLIPLNIVTNEKTVRKSIEIFLFIYLLLIHGLISDIIYHQISISI